MIKSSRTEQGHGVDEKEYSKEVEQRVNIKGG